ncbi:TPR-like protein [Dioscorea alata]|uniref:TPR-like protein n=1 Tax=Dioscorea alata TaxID=55571 RepID=A0ACB7WSU9_DIOAL|nr:TPR-like protein [Dioscorea alata]
MVDEALQQVPNHGGNEFAKQQKYLETVEHYTEALRKNSKDLRV